MTTHHHKPLFNSSTRTPSTVSGPTSEHPASNLHSQTTTLCQSKDSTSCWLALADHSQMEHSQALRQHLNSCLTGSSKYETPERNKSITLSQSMDNNSTIKREGSPSNDRSQFTTPPKRPTVPSMHQLELWERVEREYWRR